MKCPQYWKWKDDSFSQKEWEEHLQLCSECRRERNFDQNFWNQLSPPPTPPGLTDQIMEHIEKGSAFPNQYYRRLLFFSFVFLALPLAWLSWEGSPSFFLWEGIDLQTPWERLAAYGYQVSLQLLSWISMPPPSFDLHTTLTLWWGGLGALLIFASFILAYQWSQSLTRKEVLQ